MYRFILPLFCLLTNSLVSQKAEGQSPSTDSSQGIQFEKGLSWKEIKEKAKAENKYIFVDCYATWCGPCKEMDKEV